MNKKFAVRIGSSVACLLIFFLATVFLGGKRREYQPDYSLSILQGLQPEISRIDKTTYHKFYVEKDWQEVAEIVETEIAQQKPSWVTTNPRGQDQSFKFWDPKAGHWTKAEGVMIFKHHRNLKTAVVTLSSPEYKPTKIEVFLQQCREKLERLFGGK